MSLSQIEELCERMYNPQATKEEKREAENQFNLFKQSPDFLAQSVLVLQNSNNSTAQHFAASAMRSVLTERWNQFKNGPKSVELRDWIIQFLGFRGENLEPFVMSAVIRVFFFFFFFFWCCCWWCWGCLVLRIFFFFFSFLFSFLSFSFSFFSSYFSLLILFSIVVGKADKIGLVCS